MKIRKIIALILAVVFLIPLTIVAGEMDEELENLILSVKERIAIPKEYTEFSYDLESQEDGNVYSLCWSREDRDDTIYVSVEENGTIISYSRRAYRINYSELAKISYEQGLKEAKAFIEQIQLPYKDGLRLREEENDLRNTDYTYVFDDYVNGFRVKNRQIKIWVDKQTGEVTFFEGPRTYKGTYGDAKIKQSLEDAKKVYLEKIGIPLVYRLNYDYEQNDSYSFPAYIVYNTQDKGIDAITGEVITPVKVINDRGKMVFAGAPSDGSTTTDQELTPQERKRVEETKLLLSKDEAKQKAQVFFPRIKETTIERAELYKIRNKDQYYWSINLKNAKEDVNIYLQMNAKTGEIYQYQCYLYPYYDDENKVKINDKAVKEKVEKLLKNIAKEKYPLIRLKNNEEEKDVSSEEETGYRRYVYERIVNGIPVDDNEISIIYSGYYDEITSYSISWAETDFKDIKGVVSSDKIADLLGLELMYIDKDKNHRVLAYTHEESVMAFDPFTASRIGYYDGNSVSLPQQRTFYDDVKGHPKEAIIKILYDSGIILPGKSLRPDEKINQLDFLRLVLGQFDENQTEDYIYDMAINQGILSEDEKDPSRGVSKEEAISYIINNTAYRKIAAFTDIYRYPYEDEEEVNEKFKGHITLAHRLDIIGKDETKLFHPKQTLTRAEALELIYYYSLKRYNLF